MIQTIPNSLKDAHKAYSALQQGLCIDSAEESNLSHASVGCAQGNCAAMYAIAHLYFHSQMCCCA